MLTSLQIFYMHNKICYLVFAFILTANICFSQESFPTTKLKSVSGKEITLAEIAKLAKDTPVVVSFWATWCIPCVTELDNINEEFKDRQAVKPFKFIAVSIDDSRTAQRVKPFIKGKGWQFDVLMDINSDLKRALNVTDIPHLLIIKDNKVVYRHTGYISGQEDDLFNKIKSL